MTVSHKKSKGGSSAGLYYIECLENGKGVDDYYSSAKEPPGVWYVGATKSGSRESRFIPVEHGHLFGSDPAINDAEVFKSLVNGVDPFTKEPLIGNAMSPDRIAFHDFTCSAPKSVSVVWSQANDELAAKILKAQEKSADAFLDHISDHAYYRYGKGSVNNAQSPIRAVKFEHGSARSIDGNMVRADPQIHTHCVVLNLLESQHNDRPAYALETKSIMAQQGVGASLFHAQLAWEMRNLGFEIQKDGNLFEIAGVPQAVMKDFSQRREQIETAVKEKLEQMGLDGDIANASRGMFRAAALESRNGKGEISRIDLQAIWKERGQALGFSENEVLALMNSEIKPELTSDELKERIREAIATIQNTDSVFRKETLQIKSLVSTYGDASPDSVMSAVDEIIRTELLQANLQVDHKTNMPTLAESTWYTTPEMLITERQMLDLAGKESDAHIIKLTDAQREQMSSLKDEQMRAVEHVLSDRRAVSVVEGTAGAGKTYTMGQLSKIFKAEGYEVTGLATAWTAANNLKNEAGLDDARAITGFLRGVEKGEIQLTNKSVLILDEAGMSGSKSVHAVLQAAARAGAKTVLLGDTQQQKSVTGGDPLRMIVTQNGSARLDVITRQRDEAQRAAVPLFFQGKAREAIKAYEDQGKIHIQTGVDATQNALVARWIHDRVHLTQDQIILALDRDSVSALNSKAHEAAKTAGLVDGTHSITVDAIDNKSPIEFCVGDRVQFRKNDLSQGITNRSYGRVVEIQDERFLVETDAGRRVLVDANDERWQVEGKLALTHGYATTVYSSQGVTVERSYLADHVGLHRSAAGVALSRHRDTAHIFIDREARYLSKMKQATVDEWHPIEQFGEAECIGRMAHAWEANREKLNAMDFMGWQDENGAFFDVTREAQIKTQTNHAERALQQSRKLLNDIRSMSSQALLDRVDRMPEVSQMAFERSKRFELKTEFADNKTTHAALMRLGAEKSITEEVLADAVISGFVRVDKSGEIKFIGRDASGRNVSQQGIDDIESKKPRTAICNGVTILTEAGMRDRYPPVLLGTPDNQTVDVVKTGLDALALRSLQQTQGLEKTTIVVAKDREAFAHTHVRELMMQAKDIRRHDKTDVNLVKQNKQIQAAYEPPPKREEEMTISYSKIKGITEAENYYQNYQSSMQNYSSERLPPVWFSDMTSKTFSSQFFLPEIGKVFGSDDRRDDVAEFTSVLKGIHPKSARPMVKNAESENRTAAHIFTLTAPKSVSIAFSQADDELRKKILKAHEKATDKFLYAASMYSRYSEQKGDAHIYAPIRAVKFGHIASDGAPNIRTDCVVFGIVETLESINDHFHALDVSVVLRQANLAASIYKSQLAWEMRKLGFGIEKNKENTSFEISGMNHPTDGLDKNIQDYSQEENNRLDETIRSVIQDVARKSSVYSGNQIEIGVLAETYGDFEPDKVLHDFHVFARKNLVHAYEKYDLNCGQDWYISKDTSAERIRAFRKKHNLEFDDEIHNHEQIELGQKGEIQTEKVIDQFKKPTHEERNINNQTPSSSSNFDNGFNAKTQGNQLTQTSKAPTQSKPNAEVTNILCNVANVYVAPKQYDKKNQSSPNIARKGFESSSQFELKISQAKPIETQSVLMSYANNNSIKEAAMVDAVNAGFIHVDDKRNISFIGKNDEGKIASIQKQNQNEERLPSKSSIVGGFTISTDAGMRDKYPPILPGLDNKIAIVQTGEEALALRSMQHQHNLEKTTIIVAKNSDALSSPHIKAKLQSADQIMRFDKVDLDLKALNQNSQEKNLNTDQSLAPRQ